MKNFFGKKVVLPYIRRKHEYNRTKTRTLESGCLTAERDKYGANDVKPGLTGWAQINGRDELEIPEKAKLDGYYVQNMGFKMDAKVF